MNKYKSIICVLTTVLSACASNTPKEFAHEKIVRAQQHIPDDWLLQVEDKTSDPVQWSQIYNDPILDTYLRRAKMANFSIRIARSRVRQASANLKRANSLLKPRVNLSVAANGTSLVNDLSGAVDVYSLGVSGRWSPDIFGKTHLIIEQSRASLASQNAFSVDTAQAVLALTARAYIQAVETEMQVTLAKKNLDFLSESRRISEARYRLGDTAKGDFSFAEANYQSALASYENRLQAARQTKRALSIMLGDFPVNDLKLSHVLMTPRKFPSRSLPAKLLELRPDIIALRAQIAGQFAALRSAELLTWPSVSISGGLSAGNTISDLFDPAQYIARLTASMAQTIFDGGVISAEMDAAKAALDQSMLAYELGLRQAMGEITNAFDQAETLQLTLVNLEASSRAANEALRLESIQYDLGESSLLDVLQVQTRVNAIDASLIRTRATLITTLITANESVAGFLPLL